ncbi:hypothetical protein IW261DRAFT_1499718 [Armillaria novae-zelandiae]|uniref:Uncharacterized protein n=1 Tax=Armillaria novae-zelandiae TaxID=153914 RepID=A0AA39NYI7_9AGAR|nr:hypothetical protein IW261DRAFT_1499718 [Armillaria novae-zelandiae]
MRRCRGIDKYGPGRPSRRRSHAAIGLSKGGLSEYIDLEYRILRTHWWQENHTAVSERVRAWRNDIAFVPRHTPPIHPFDAHRRVFSFFDDEPYTPGSAPDDAPTFEALAREYDRWFLLTLLGKFRYDDWKASRGGTLSGAASTELDDWDDFLRQSDPPPPGPLALGR